MADSNDIKLIPLTQGKFTVVDADDYERLSLYKWYYNKGYARGLVGSMHRYITCCPMEMQVDHINGDKLDNRKDNLRVCTHAQNQQNSKKSSRGITSKYKGVHWKKAWGKWVAQISINGTTEHLGGFILESDAADAYNKAAKELRGEFARINNIEKGIEI